MTTYKGIKGFTVQSLASDPSPLVEGQLWYNSASNVWKGAAEAAGTWAAGGTMIVQRARGAGAGTTQTAGLGFGGIPGPTPGVAGNLCESYNGSTWTEVNEINTPNSYLSGCGPQTAALHTGGSPGGDPSVKAITETFDGTTWTEVGDLNTARAGCSTAGITTAALASGGNLPGLTNIVETYNGSTWTEVADINTSRRYLAAGSSGTPTAALVFGGGSPGVTGATESFNGTTWTEVADITARSFLGGTGTQTSALAFGGTPTPSGITESWNGSAWTEVADMSGTRDGGSYGGVATDAFFANGDSVPGPNADCEEFTAGVQATTVTTS